MLIVHPPFMVHLVALGALGVPFGGYNSSEQRSPQARAVVLSAHLRKLDKPKVILSSKLRLVPLQGFELFCFWWLGWLGISHDSMTIDMKRGEAKG